MRAQERKPSTSDNLKASSSRLILIRGSLPLDRRNIRLLKHLDVIDQHDRIIDVLLPVSHQLGQINERGGGGPDSRHKMRRCRGNRRILNMGKLECIRLYDQADENSRFPPSRLHLSQSQTYLKQATQRTA